MSSRKRQRNEDADCSENQNLDTLHHESIEALNGDTSRFMEFKGEQCLRLRLILSALFKRPIKVTCIRDDVKHVVQNIVGLQQYETNLLRLLDLFTDGATFDIDASGTIISFAPGIILGSEGRTLLWKCESRNISYYLEMLAFLAPFGKTPLKIRLQGITHGTAVPNLHEPTVQHFINIVMPILSSMQLFSDCEEKPHCHVIRPGFAPEGLGEVEFYCPIIRKVKPFQLLHTSRVQRIRGVAYTHNVSPQYGNHMIRAVRRVLNDYLPDVWISQIKSSSPATAAATKIPFFGIHLSAETMKHDFKGVDWNSSMLPEKEKSFAERTAEMNVPVVCYDIKKLLSEKQNQIVVKSKVEDDHADWKGQDSEAIRNTEDQEEATITDEDELDNLTENSDHCDSSDLSGASDIDTIVPSKFITHGSNSAQRKKTLDQQSLKSRKSRTQANNEQGRSSKEEKPSSRDKAGTSNGSTDSDSASLSDEDLRKTPQKIVGEQAAFNILYQIKTGGILDTTYQHIPFLFMALAEETQSSKMITGPLTRYSIEVFRHIRDFCNVKFKFTEHTCETAKLQYVAECVGVGFKNLERKTC